jgi:hypothetical protein
MTNRKGFSSGFEKPIANFQQNNSGIAIRKNGNAGRSKTGGSELFGKNRSGRENRF